jgi:hypothetical protein
LRVDQFPENLKKYALEHTISAPMANEVQILAPALQDLGAV